MEDRIYIRGSTAEFSVFKKITDVSWGVQHRTYLPVENSSWKNPTEEKVMLYVPLYDALGHDYGSQSTINFNKLALRYNIIDKEAEDYILEFLKLSISETEQVEWGTVKRSEFIFQFDPESIKNMVIHRVEEESDEVNFYITLGCLPEVKQFVKTEDINGILKTGSIQTIRSPLWKDDIFENSITPQLILRITGDWDAMFDDEWESEFSHLMNLFKCPYVNLPFYNERMATSKWHEAIKVISNYLNSMPFCINYSFLWLFSTKVIKLLDYSLSQYVEAFEWVLKESKRDENSIEVINTLLEFSKSLKPDPSISLISYLKSKLHSISSLLNRIVKKGMMKIRRWIITPSYFQFKFPTTNTPNRVLRNFSAQKENFMRVSFQSTSHQSGKYNSSNNSNY
jgi:hypothetical protein